MVYKELEKHIPDVIKEKSGHDWKTGLVCPPSFQLKIIQLYETCVVRHGFMLVGPTGSGKTTIMRVLTECLTRMGTKTVIIRMNPKAITDGEMYGVKSEISDDWI